MLCPLIPKSMHPPSNIAYTMSVSLNSTPFLLTFIYVSYNVSENNSKGRFHFNQIHTGALNVFQFDFFTVQQIWAGVYYKTTWRCMKRKHHSITDVWLLNFCHMGFHYQHGLSTHSR